MKYNIKNNAAAALPALVFVGLLGFVSAANLLTPQKAFSEMENRELAQFPAVSAEKIRSGEWMSSFENYSSDQFLFRDGLMEIKTAADLALRRKDNGRVYFGEDGYLFAIDTIDKKQENAALTLTGDFIRRVKTTYPSLNVSVLLAPTAQAVLPDKLPSHAPAADQPGALRRAEACLSGIAPDVVFTSPLDALTEAANQRSGTAGQDVAPLQLYYRTDHHWTTDGAYIAYRRWALDNGLTPFDSSAFRRDIVSEDFCGTNQAKAPGMPTIPDQITRYTPKETAGGPAFDPAKAAGPLEAADVSGTKDAIPAEACRITVWKDVTKPDQTEIRDSLYDDSFLRTKDQYGYFLGGNDPQVRIETPVKNGRRLLLIKDSYANSMIPFLALHYEEIYVTDLRYSHGKLILAGDAAPFTDAMVLYNIDSFCSDKNLAYLTQLRF